jgi:hypothetical protein
MKTRIWYNGVDDMYYPQIKLFFLFWIAWMEECEYTADFPARFCTLEDAQDWMNQQNFKALQEEKQRKIDKENAKLSKVVFVKTYE